MFLNKFDCIMKLKMFFVGVLLVSLAGCNSSDSQNENSKEKVNPPKSYSHGSAEISCTILETKKVDNSNLCIVMVDKVIGYGAGVPPIGTNTELELVIPEMLVNKKLEINSKHLFTLRFTKQKLNTGNNFWTVSKIE